MSQFKSNILFKISASISCYKACDVISELTKLGHSVKVVISKNALNFIGTATLEGLTKNPVYFDEFENGKMMSHIELARWANIIVLCPASAHTINGLANGTLDGLLGTIFLAHDFKKPYLVFPAMNSMMLNHPTTQESINRLSKMGVQVQKTDKGQLACGEVGPGKLLKPEEIKKLILNNLKHSHENALNSKNKKNILITCGGTKEPIDGVRFISNSSTGATGFTIAKHLIENGHSVTLITSQKNDLDCRQLFFEDFLSLQNILENELSNQHYDSIIHAAAVSDYKVKNVTNDQGEVINLKVKIPSNQSISINLSTTPKIISSLKKWSMNKNLQVIGFKLTNFNDLEKNKLAVSKLFEESNPDWVVHNDSHCITSQKHEFNIYHKSILKISGYYKFELAEALNKIVTQNNSIVNLEETEKEITL